MTTVTGSRNVTGMDFEAGQRVQVRADSECFGGMTGVVLGSAERGMGRLVVVYPDAEWFLRQYLAGTTWAVPVDLGPEDLELSPTVTDRRNCGRCGEPFIPKRTDAHYCSPACRQRAYRLRHGQQGIYVPLDVEAKRKHDQAATAAHIQRLTELATAPRTWK